jgi:acyl-CoA dehydrogenase
MTDPSRTVATATDIDLDLDLDQVRESVQKICRRFGVEYWREKDRTHAYPGEFMQTMGEAGYFGTLIPTGHGGLDAGPEVASVVVEEINRAGGDAATVNAQLAICGTLVRHGSEAQKARYLPGIASADIRLLTVAATEPDSGADMTHLKSTARRDADSWILNAHKVLVSLAEQTDLTILLVTTSEGPTLFLLPMAEFKDRVELHPIELIANRHTTTMFIDELRVSDEIRLGPVGRGLECLMSGFAVRRVLAAAESLGNARFFLDRSLEHAKVRRTFGRFIGQNQGVQYPLAQAYARIEAADLMRWDALRLVRERHADAQGRAALAKILASEAAWEAGRAALTTFGGWALAGEYHLERKLREATVFVFNNMLLSIVAERSLGLPKAF